MDNLTEIKAELDRLYEQYKKNKSSLNDTQTEEAVCLLKKLSQNGDTKDVAERLVVFSEKICSQYFDELTRGAVVPIDIVESIINDYKIKSKERNYTSTKKNAAMVIKVVNNYSEVAYSSKILAELTALAALKSGENNKQFKRMIQETKGHIFLIDYTTVNKKDLNNVCKIAMMLSLDNEIKPYNDLINSWAEKYGFIEKVKKENIPEDDTVAETEKPNKQSVPVSEDSSEAVAKNNKIDDSAGEPVKSVGDMQQSALANAPEPEPEKTKTADTGTDNSDENNKPTPKKDDSFETLIKKVYSNLKRDMSKEQETIISAVTELISPMGKAVDSIREEVSKSRDIAAENAALKTKIAELEHQASEQKANIQQTAQALSDLKAENNELKIRIAELESQKSELDSKLGEAYAINSREASLEAEKIRSELKKAFAFLYEDWLEYEFSDVSEDNYESLQAIIKKSFRSLERNGIEFKENNK